MEDLGRLFTKPEKEKNGTRRHFLYYFLRMWVTTNLHLHFPFNCRYSLLTCVIAAHFLIFLNQLYFYIKNHNFK